MDVLLVVAVSGLYLLPAARADFDGRWPRPMASSPGLCRYGSRIDCCWGWARQSWGQCQPVCHPGCKHGECVGPNKCKCHPGYTGKTCNQDLNECGLKPRPCKHRCMNTYGSYKCYCLNGYMLMPDGSCSNAHTCSMANCQYGCDVLKGEVRCRCPSPGLRLAPDGRTCLDVDECSTGGAVCPRFRKCINTFGSYICKCHKGYDLIYIGGKYQCHDIDECASGAYECSGLARCYNTQGSYKCKCKEGYRGNGADCTPVPKVWIDPSVPFVFGNGKDNSRHIYKGNSTSFKGKGGQSNRIPDIIERGTARPPIKPFVPPIIITPKPVPRTTTRTNPRTTSRPTPVPTTRPVVNPVTRPVPKPFTRPPPKPTTITTTVTTRPTPKPTTRSPAIVTEALPSRGGTTVDNRIQVDPQKPRGDVFIPRLPGVHNGLFDGFEIEKGLSADEYEANDDPGAVVHSCNFDSGLCGWIREREDDLRWEPARDPSGGQYLRLSEAKGKAGRMARLVLPVDQLANAGDLCLSFRHKLSGLPSGSIQVSVKRSRTHAPPVWGRDTGHSWRHTSITLKGAADIRNVIFKGERAGPGDIGLDDVNLMKGPCAEAH
ncbi:nephronectin isoform X2 [Ambystoma mexicanum]|uniref:nephronectin isoform X2 n=1 Tax=Ambystoma mexicanum TaxID=8296 RepID=UPI0037E991B6